MFTYIIIAATVIISFTCFKDNQLFNKLALKPFRIIHSGEWFRIISHGFVHGDGMHLFVNMFTFWSFGQYMEKAFRYFGIGSWAFLILYFGGMIVASLHDVIRYRNASWYTSIGASGAVSAVLFSAIFLNPWDKILLLQLFLSRESFSEDYIYSIASTWPDAGGDSINHNAHFYGALYGFVFPALLKPELFTAFLRHF